MTHSSSEIRIWAFNGINIPADFCQDARLRGDSDEEVDQPYGQAMWDLAIEFANARHLASQLKSGKLPDHMCAGGAGCSSPVCPKIGNVSFLGICVHGSPGLVDIDGTSRILWGQPLAGQDFLCEQTIDAHKYDAELTQIGNVMKKEGTIMFMSCWAARGSVLGTNLLIKLSRIWKDIYVAGIVTMGYVGSHQYQGRSRWFRGTCTEPGMRATDCERPVTSDQERWDRILKPEVWNDLGRLPWAWPTIDRAKVAFNGRITKTAAMDGDW